MQKTALIRSSAMRTTLDLPDETFRLLKAQAAMKGLKLKELVAQFIDRGLAGVMVSTTILQRAPLSSPIDANPYPIPIARVADGSITPYLSNAQLYAVLEAHDVALYQRLAQDQALKSASKS